MRDNATKIMIAILVLAMIGGAVALGGVFRNPAGRGPSTALVGQAAPPFNLAVVTGPGSRQGDRIALESLQGRVVLLDFWAGWCGPCRQSIPILNRIHERYGDELVVLGVNVESGARREAVQASHRRFGAAFTSVQDQRFETQNAYLVRNIPTLVLIDRTGVVRWADVGVPDEDEILEGVARLR